MLEAVAGGLSLCLCSHTRPISQTGTAGVILLRMDVVIVGTGCAFAVTVSWEHTWAGAGETMEREFWIWGWWVSVYFWCLKDDSPSYASLLPLLSSSLPSSCKHNNNKAASVNSGCDIYLKTGVFTYNRY